jgi:hypothetical protein
MNKNRVKRVLYGSKREELTGGLRKLHNEELHNLYASPNIIKLIKSRSMRWVGPVASMGEMRNGYSNLVGKPEGKKKQLDDTGIDGRIILERSLEKLGCKVWTGFIWLRIGTSVGRL